MIVYYWRSIRGGARVLFIFLVRETIFIRFCCFRCRRYFVGLVDHPILTSDLIFSRNLLAAQCPVAVYRMERKTKKETVPPENRPRGIVKRTSNEPTNRKREKKMRKSYVFDHAPRHIHTHEYQPTPHKPFPHPLTHIVSACPCVRGYFFFSCDLSLWHRINFQSHLNSDGISTVLNLVIQLILKCAFWLVVRAIVSHITIQHPQSQPHTQTHTTSPLKMQKIYHRRRNLKSPRAPRSWTRALLPHDSTCTHTHSLFYFMDHTLSIPISLRDTNPFHIYFIVCVCAE